MLKVSRIMCALLHVIACYYRAPSAFLAFGGRSYITHSCVNYLSAANKRVILRDGIGVLKHAFVLVLQAFPFRPQKRFD